jgi:hypothetical protein
MHFNRTVVLLFGYFLAAVAMDGAALTQANARNAYYKGMSRNSPNCPSIYYLFRELSDTPVGYVWFGDASGMSKATGTMDLQSGRFHLTLTPLDGDGPTGEVTGVKERFTGTVTAELQGPGCSKLKLGPMKPFVRKADGTD